MDFRNWRTEVRFLVFYVGFTLSFNRQYLSLFVNLFIGKDARIMEKMHAAADIYSINDIRYQFYFAMDFVRLEIVLLYNLFRMPIFMIRITLL